ncbi:hypothetical protein [Izhakiella australiensis]|nr:hypothetical protein [Izhakiella australiensis]
MVILYKASWGVSTGVIGSIGSKFIFFIYLAMKGKTLIEKGISRTKLF